MQLSMHKSIDTDKNGFRAYGDINTKSKKKVLFIGNSPTLAIDVSNDKTYYEILAKELPIEVFAYGGGGFNNIQEYIVLDEFIDVIKPDIIIWQLCRDNFGGNFYDYTLMSEVTNAQTTPYMTKEGELFYAIPRPIGYIHKLSNYSRLLYFLLTRRVDDKIYRMNQGEFDKIKKEMALEGKNHPYYKESIEIMNEIVKKFRIRAKDSKIFAFCVDGSDMFLYDELKVILERNNIDFIDGIPSAITEADKDMFLARASDKAHWNEYGHKIVADKIKEYLSNNKVLSK